MSALNTNDSSSIDWMALSQELSLLFSLLHYNRQANDSSSTSLISHSSKQSSPGAKHDIASTAEPNVTLSSREEPQQQHLHSLLKNVLAPFWSQDAKMYKQMHNFTFLDSLVMAAPGDTQGGNAAAGHHYFLGGNDSSLHQASSLPSYTPGSATINPSQYNYDNFTYVIDTEGCSGFSYEYVDYTQNIYVRDAFVAMYIVIIALSIIGNLMVIYTVWRNKHMRTTTNYYIVNLAMCDFLVAIFVMPLKLLEYTAPCTWQVFGRYGLCSFVSFILPVFVFASVLTLVAISIERYYAIVYPINAFTVSSKSRTKMILLATWIIPLLFAGPYLFCHSYSFNIQSDYGSLSRQICNDRFDDIDKVLFGDNESSSGRFRKGFFLFLFVTIYLIPLVVIVTTCVRIAMCLLKPLYQEQQESTCGMRMTRRQEESKRRVAKMIIAVALAFIMCWSPFYWVSLVSQVQQKSFLRNSNFLFTMLATHLVGFLNSAINPFIYHTMNDKFRKSFRSILLRIFCCIVPLLRKRRKHSWGARCDGASGPYCGYVGSSLNPSNEPQAHTAAAVHRHGHTMLPKHTPARSMDKPRQTYNHQRHVKYYETLQQMERNENIVPMPKTCSVTTPPTNLTRNYRGERQKLDIIIHNKKTTKGDVTDTCCCPCHISCGPSTIRHATFTKNAENNKQQVNISQCNHVEIKECAKHNPTDQNNCGSDSCFEDDLDVGSSEGSAAMFPVSCESINVQVPSNPKGDEGDFSILKSLTIKSARGHAANKTLSPAQYKTYCKSALQLHTDQNVQSLVIQNDSTNLRINQNQVAKSIIMNHRKYASLESLSKHAPVVHGLSPHVIVNPVLETFNSCSRLHHFSREWRDVSKSMLYIHNIFIKNHLNQKCVSAQEVATKCNDNLITRSKSWAQV